MNLTLVKRSVTCVYIGNSYPIFEYTYQRLALLEIEIYPSPGLCDVSHIAHKNHYDLSLDKKAALQMNTYISLNCPIPNVIIKFTNNNCKHKIYLEMDKHNAIYKNGSYYKTNIEIHFYGMRR